MGGAVRAPIVLARLRCADLEHRHVRRPSGDRRDAGEPGSATASAQLRAERGAACAAREPGLVHVRDRHRARPRDRRIGRRARADGFDRRARIERLRGACWHAPRSRRPPPRRTWARDMDRPTRAHRPHAGPRRAALLPGRRRRAERPGARRAVEAAQCPDAGGRPIPQPGRQLAGALSLALSPRPGLPRRPAVPALPRPLAALHPQGQDGRLAGSLRQGDGARFLGRHRSRLGALR